MHTLSLPAHGASPQRFSANSCLLELPHKPWRFFRHGWQSWAFSSWVDPQAPAVPIRAAQFRAKDEDPLYALAQKHTSAWVAAVQLDVDDIVLIGGMDWGARVQFEENRLRAFYESGEGEWLLVRSTESEAFSYYTQALLARYPRSSPRKTPRVWCSWYSLYRFIREESLHHVLRELGDLPFDVFQIDDGWQISTGDWEANPRFPSGMADLAERIRASGRQAGLWLSPFIVTPDSTIYRKSPEWLLRDSEGKPVFAGRNWSGMTYALDVTHPAVLEWLEETIRRVIGWGYSYLKLDFLYAAALPGRRYREMPRETAYRQALAVIRAAAPEAYLLACGAPILPSLGLCDGIRIGPDVTPFWLNRALSVWLSNPNHPSTQNALRTSLHRLWLKPLIDIDPDVVYFRSRHNALTPEQRRWMADLASICGFRSTSDPPHWLTASEREQLRSFLEQEMCVEPLGEYRFRLDGREVDFRPILPLPSPQRVPLWFATSLGFLQMGVYEVLPALWESLRIRTGRNLKRGE
ncbi:MAG: alpha-galactosidase [Anaerolineales bacterium]|nr:alpha-galactosidase [Anaerolineales bacterium]MDW8445769.1 alpha-galactosidase [Anaerolineales bacterium]